MQSFSFLGFSGLGIWLLRQIFSKSRTVCGLVHLCFAILKSLPKSASLFLLLQIFLASLHLQNGE